jgi:peptidoglycan/LPS O-acetylase OafA/YrhL
MFPDSPTRASEPRRRLPSLTAMRFFAFLCVFIYHSSSMLIFRSVPVRDGYAFVAQNIGYTGVSFFFVLSGFILTWNARPGEPRRPFMRRRLARIYPSHLVMWVVSLLLFGVTILSVVPDLFNLLLLQAWLPNPLVYGSLDGPTWTLSAELFFYFMFPRILRRVNRIRPERLMRWAIGVVLTLLIITMLAGLMPGITIPVANKTAPFFGVYLVYIFPPVRLLEFVLGVVVGRMYIERRLPRVRLANALSLLTVAYTVSLFLPAVYGYSVVTVVPVVLLIVAVADMDVRGTPSVLRSRTWQRLGELSFALYMTHFVILEKTRGEYVTNYYLKHKTVPPGPFSVPAGIGVILLWFAASMLAAYLLNRFVERPGIRRGSIRRPRAATADWPGQAPPVADADGG